VPDRECSSVPGCGDASACLKVTHPGDRAGHPGTFQVPCPVFSGGFAVF